MKLRNVLTAFLVLCSVNLVASCELAPNSSNSENNSTTETNTSTATGTNTVTDTNTNINVDLDSKYYDVPNWEESSLDINIGGDLLDAEVGRDYMTGAEYMLSFTLGSTIVGIDPNLTVIESSNEEVFVIDAVSGGYKLKALHAGRAFLTIKDSIGIIRYRKLVTVSDPIALEDMEEYLVYECEYWVSIMSWSDQFTITFYEGGIYSITGSISNEAFAPVTGTYEYVETLNNGKEYSYIFTDTDIAATGLIGFHIATTGTFMYLQSDLGTDAILFPNDKI